MSDNRYNVMAVGPDFKKNWKKAFRRKGSLINAIESINNAIQSIINKIKEATSRIRQEADKWQKRKN
jgi:hypothetical protein